jgi:Tfp pilus assembly protein PilF
MLCRSLLAPVVVLAATSLAGAQLNRTPPRRVELVVQVFYQGEQHPAGAWLTVQLLDGFGTPEGEQATDQQGMVRFRTISGIHRLRIIGPGIVEYNGTIDIENVEARRFEIVRVGRKPDAVPVPRSREGTVPVIRLKVPATARKEFERGGQALERKDWGEAKKRFEGAIALYPDYDLAYNGLGVAAIGLGDVGTARRAFEKAISLNENYSGAHRNLARILFAERKYADAEVLLAKSLENEPLNAWALTFLAYAELLTHKFDKAIVNARKVHALPHEGFASAHAIAAKALEATGQPEQALAEYQLYLKEDPNGPNAAQAREAVARISSLPSR